MPRALPFVMPIAVLASFLAFSQAEAQVIDQSKEGLILANRVCSQCHMVEVGESSSPNAAAPRFEDIANTPGMTATAISAVLHTSHSTMPNVILDSDQTGDIVAYLLSLKRATR